MAHPSSTLPKNVYILSNGNALKSGQGLPRGSRVFALTNPTDTAITASCIGSNKVWDTDAYKATDASQDIAVQPGATIYGSWSSVSAGADGLLAYVG